MIDKEVDFIIAQFSITPHRNQFITPSIAYFYAPWVLMIPAGSPFTPFEKLLRPFNVNSWIAVFVLFIIAVFVITIVSFSSIKVRNEVFGSNNRHPYLNIVEVFLGGTLNIKNLPTKNFARTLLMVFILYSLVIRTIYQGCLVKNLQSEDRKPSVSSIDEMLQKDFKLYLRVQALEHAEFLPFKDLYALNFNKLFFL